MATSGRWTLFVALLAAVGSAAAPLRLTAVNDDGGERYLLAFELEARSPWADGQRAELVFDAGSDSSGYALVLESDRAKLVCRQADGQERLLAESNRHPAAAVPLRGTLIRDRWRMAVVIGEVVWMSAYDDTLPAGSAAYGTSADSLVFTRVSPQSTQEIWFADDFMRAEGEHGDWEALAGKWSASGVSEADAQPKKRPDPNLSSNPFAYRTENAKARAVCATGYWFWTNYRFSASVRAAGQGELGLCFFLRDDENYLSFRWANTPAGGQRRVVATLNGYDEVLATAPGGWGNDQWYRLTVQVVDQHVTCKIDGEKVLDLDCDFLGHGRVGLLAEGVTFADFDDVEVVSTESLVDTFSARTGGRWAVVRGQWQNDDLALGPLNEGLKVARGDREGLTVTGSTEWSDYRIQTTARARRGGGFGVVACWQDEANYLALRWGDARAPAEYRNNLQLIRVRDGKPQLLGRYQTPFNPELWHTLAIENRRGFVRASVGGQVVFESFDPALTDGKAGLLASGEVTFDETRVEFLPPEPRVEFTAQFTEEDTMAAWAQAAGSWWVDQAPWANGVIWHRGDFYGDSQLAVSPELFGGEPRTIRLILAGNGSPGSGYHLVLVQPEAGQRKIIAELQSAAGGGGAGEPGAMTDDPGGVAPPAEELPPDLAPEATGRPPAPATGPQAAPQPPARTPIQLPALRRANLDLTDAEALRFVRRGRFLLVYQDDECVLGWYEQGQPQTGRLAGVRVDGGELPMEQVVASSDHNFDTTFVKAPHEWLVSKGLWETVNRWKCDPRWSFFGGYADRHPLIWSKDDYGGDMQLEAYLAVKMDLPGPPWYLHPSDLGLTMCGNGRDVTSGYTLLFAARNNTCSLLYKNGELVAENKSEAARFRHTTPQGDGLWKFHRAWFHLVLRRAAGRLTATVDDELLFDLPDTDPIASGKVAVFAVNNGLMVSRVKVWYANQPPRAPMPEVDTLLAGANPGQAVSDPFQNDFESGVGAHRMADRRQPVRVSLSDSGAASGRSCLEVTNLASGGELGLATTAQPFAVADRPRLSFKYKMTTANRVHLYALAGGKWHVIAFAGECVSEEPQILLGRVDGATLDGQWHEATIDLAALFAKAYPGRPVTIEQLVLGNRETAPYVYAGFGANLFGSRYWLDDWRLGK